MARQSPPQTISSLRSTAQNFEQRTDPDCDPIEPEMDNRPQSDEMGEIRIRMRISNLEARLAMREIEIAALSREIASSLTSSNRRQEAIKRRDAEQADWWLIRAELDEMRRLYPRFAHH